MSHVREGISPFCDHVCGHIDDVVVFDGGDGGGGCWVNLMQT